MKGQKLVIIRLHIVYNHRNDSLVVFEMLSKGLLELRIKSVRLQEGPVRYARRNTNGASSVPSNASGCPLSGGARRPLAS